MSFFLTPAADNRDASLAEAAPQSWAEIGRRDAARRDADFKAFAEVFRANDEAQTYTQNAMNLLARRERAYDERIKAVKEATGVALENPLRVARMPTMDELRARHPDENIVDTRKRLFADRLHQLQQQHPDKADRIRAALSIDEQAREIGRAAEARAEAVNADPDAPEGSWLAGFAGTMRGYLRDPLQVGTLFVGGPEGGAAANVALRILSSVGRNAAINAGVESVLQVPAQMGRAEAGLEAGIGEAAGNVALAAGLGGAVGGAMTGIGEMIRAGRAAPTDVGAARSKLDPEMQTEFDTAVDAGRDEAAAFADPPAGVTPEEAGRMATEAVDQVADGGPPVSGAVIKPERPADLAQVLDEAAEAPAGRIDVQGKPAAFSRFDPSTLETDAAAYQYKDGGDAAGVTDRLAGVEKWDPTASGKVFVHERADGKRFVADGHQRLGLAKRLRQAGDDGVVLDGYLFREADGWTVAEVRALAAKKNMQEGSGTPLDAARILRDSPELLDDSLPVSGPMMRKAVAISRLSDDAFGMTVNGMVPENHAALVGEMVADPALHSGVLQDLAHFAPETDRQARLLIGESLSSGRQVEIQNDMFGAFRIERTLMGERVKVLDAAIKALRSDKRLFGTLLENAEVIAAAGNQLDTAGNRQRAASAETVGELLDRMARTRGPVSDALSAAARQVAEGTAKPGPAARKFVQDVRAMIDEGGLGRLLAPPEPELRPAATVEPGSPEAARMADEAQAPPPAAPPARPALEAGRRVSLGPTSITLTPLEPGPYFRETSPDGLDDLIAWPGAGRWFVANDPDLAIGQGANKGVMVTLRGEALSGERHRKPGLMPDAASTEFAVNFIGEDAVDSVRMAAEAFRDVPARVRRILADRFDRNVLDDGSLEFIRKPVAPPEPEPVPVRAADEPPAADAAPAEPTAAELEAAGQRSMWDMLPDGVDAEGNQRFTSSDELAARAARDDDMADVVKSCKD